MKQIRFVTSNKDKVKEAQAILKEIKVIPLALELPELQGDPETVTREKTRYAFSQLKKPLIVDVTALCFDALHGLPGIYIKHFLEKLGREGVVKLLHPYSDKRATAICSIGYHDGKKIRVFVGETRGTIVQPRGDRFGWDPVFQPEGFHQTYAEMTEEEKNKISHRTKALEKLRSFLLD